MEFAIIKNPRNWFLKHEVWCKGEGTMTDNLGQPVSTRRFCYVDNAFRTEEAAAEYVKYRRDTRAFRGFGN